jgi:hypothetical protein
MFYKATSGLPIFNTIQEESKSSYVQVILAKPNSPGVPSFVLGFYGTNNKFTRKDVKVRMDHIKRELSKRDINVLCFGSDGDPRFLAAQKTLKNINYGNIKDFGAIKIAGDIYMDCMASQDGLHLAKKLKNVFYDKSYTIRLGNFNATLNHLKILHDNYRKSEHLLNECDIDSRDKMNYNCIDKITNQLYWIY